MVRYVSSHATEDAVGFDHCDRMQPRMRRALIIAITCNQGAMGLDQHNHLQYMYICVMISFREFCSCANGITFKNQKAEEKICCQQLDKLQSHLSDDLSCIVQHEGTFVNCLSR